MADLHITYYAGTMNLNGEAQGVAMGPEVGVEKMGSVGTSATASGNIPDNATIAELQVIGSGTLHYRLRGGNATTDDTPIVAGYPKYVGIQAHGTRLLSVRAAA